MKLIGVIIVLLAIFQIATLKKQVINCDKLFASEMGIGYIVNDVYRCYGSKRNCFNTGVRLSAPNWDAIRFCKRKYKNFSSFSKIIKQRRTHLMLSPLTSVIDELDAMYKKTKNTKFENLANLLNIVPSSEKIANVRLNVIKSLTRDVFQLVQNKYPRVHLPNFFRFSRLIKKVQQNEDNVKLKTFESLLLNSNYRLKSDIFEIMMKLFNIQSSSLHTYCKFVSKDKCKEMFVHLSQNVINKIYNIPVKPAMMHRYANQSLTGQVNNLINRVSQCIQNRYKNPKFHKIMSENLRRVKYEIGDKTDTNNICNKVCDLQKNCKDECNLKVPENWMNQIIFYGNNAMTLEEEEEEMQRIGKHIQSLCSGISTYDDDNNKMPLDLIDNLDLSKNEMDSTKTVDKLMDEVQKIHCENNVVDCNRDSKISDLEKILEDSIKSDEVVDVIKTDNDVYVDKLEDNFVDISSPERYNELANCENRDENSWKTLFTKFTSPHPICYTDLRYMDGYRFLQFPRKHNFMYICNNDIPPSKLVNQSHLNIAISYDEEETKLNIKNGQNLKYASNPLHAVQFTLATISSFIDKSFSIVDFNSDRYKIDLIIKFDNNYPDYGFTEKNENIIFINFRMANDERAYKSMMHEMLHYLGLSHSKIFSSAMFAEGDHFPPLFIYPVDIYNLARYYGIRNVMGRKRGLPPPNIRIMANKIHKRYETKKFIGPLNRLPRPRRDVNKRYHEHNERMRHTMVELLKKKLNETNATTTEAPPVLETTTIVLPEYKEDKTLELVEEKLKLQEINLAFNKTLNSMLENENDLPPIEDDTNFIDESETEDESITTAGYCTIIGIVAGIIILITILVMNRQKRMYIPMKNSYPRLLRLTKKGETKDEEEEPLPPPPPSPKE